jgi:hypothetical protein
MLALLIGVALGQSSGLEPRPPALSAGFPSASLPWHPGGGISASARRLSEHVPNRQQNNGANYVLTVFGVVLSYSGLWLCFIVRTTQKINVNIAENGVEAEGVVHGKTHWEQRVRNNNSNANDVKHHFYFDLSFEAHRMDGTTVRVRHKKYMIPDISFLPIWEEMSEDEVVTVKYLQENPADFRVVEPDLLPSTPCCGLALVYCVGSIFVAVGVFICRDVIALYGLVMACAAATLFMYGSEIAKKVISETDQKSYLTIDELDGGTAAPLLRVEGHVVKRGVHSDMDLEDEEYGDEEEDEAEETDETDEDAEHEENVKRGLCCP